MGELLEIDQQEQADRSNDDQENKQDGKKPDALFVIRRRALAGRVGSAKHPTKLPTGAPQNKAKYCGFIE